jgi:protease II
MTELSFWERIGFTSKSKRVMMLVKGKQKIDESYFWLRSTMIQGKQLKNLLQAKKTRIADLQTEQEQLMTAIAEAQQELIKHDGLVEEARSELKQTESRKN